MEMAGDEIVADGGSSEIVAGEENSRESAGEKKGNGAEREKHGGVELHASVPERAEPTDQQDGGGESERRSQQGKDQRRKRIHAAGKHVLAPNAKTENADAAQRQNNEAFLPHRLAGKRGNQMRDEAKAREHGHVDFRVREKPEQALPQNGNGVRYDSGRLTRNEIQHWKKVRAQESIREQADASRQQNAENQQAQDGVDEPGPNGEWQPGKRHALGAQVDGSDAEV